MKSPSKFVLACGFAGMMLAVGFQASTLKIGSVDLAKVFNESDAAKKQQDVIRNLQTSRSGVLEFVNTYKMMKPEDAQKLKDLTVKENGNDADKAQAQAVKDNAVKLEARMRELQTKQNLSDGERTELAAFNQNTQTNLGLLGRWEQEFTQELQDKLGKLKADTLDKARQAVAQVGRDGAYTIVFTQDVAPYAGTDVTADALKAMNKIK